MERTVKMGTSSKIIIIFLFFLNIIAVFMGYAGIDKIHRLRYPPFHSGSLYTLMYSFKCVPDPVILFWYSTLGTYMVWIGAIVLPLVAAYLIFYEMKIWTGLILMLVSLLLFGFTGFMIWFHAFIDLPH